MLKGVLGFLIFVGMLVGLVWAIPRASQDGGEEPTRPTQVSVTEVGPAGYVAQEGDSCWSIAKALTGVESEENARAFATLNSFSISQESRLRDVPYEECPIRAGETYKIPADWVPGGVVVQTVEVDNDYPHWKSIAFIGISCAVVFGVILGRAAPPLFRLFRPRGPLEVPLEHIPR